jgi:hypothetical protein
MEGIRFIDIYATKGIEYLIVIAFLSAFVLFCRYMYRPSAGMAGAPENVTRFRIPEGLFYHQGHGWLGRSRAPSASSALTTSRRSSSGRSTPSSCPP